MTMTSDWIIMSALSIWFVSRHSRIQVDRRFIIKNILLICLLGSGIYYVRDMLFTIDDAYRYQNIALLA